MAFHLRFHRALVPALAVILAGCSANVPGSVAPVVSPRISPGVSGSAPSPTAGLTPVPVVPGGSGVPGAGLEPTEAELMLLKGMRLDLRGVCGPVREGLPAGADGEVRCVPTTEVVTSVIVDAFDTQEAMLAAYFEQLDTAGVVPQANDGTTSEGAWMPGPDDGRSTPQRGASWVAEGGVPMYVATQPPYVLITIVGSPDATPDTPSRFAWLGNEDQPGAPAVWRESPVDAEK